MIIKNMFPVLIAGLVAFSGYTTEKAKQQPNILWIIAEDLSAGDLGAYGNTLVNTPNIDQLALGGVKFTRVFTTAPICTPSRTALAVGMHQGSIGAHHMRYPDSLKPALPENIHTIHTHFRNNGYVTANIEDEPGNGKVDWSFKAGLTQQFDFYHWEELARQDKPFFAQINIHYTHRPFPENPADGIVEEAITIPPYYPDHPVTRRDFASYYRSIEKLDNEVGKVLASLENYGFSKNTIVFFFSDHGRPMPRGKGFNYDSGIEIPAIIYFPRQMYAPEEYEPGTSDERLISAIDFSATFLSLAGIKKPQSMHGRVFWGTNKDPDREFVFSAVDRTGEAHFKSRAIRSKEYKYIRNYRHDYSINEMATAYRKANHPIYHLLNILHEQHKLTPAQLYLVEDLPEEELYQLKEDPYETNNLAEASGYQDVRRMLRNKLEKHLEEVNDQGLQPDSKQIIKAFEQYGEHSLQQHRQQIQQLHEEVRKQVSR